MRKAFIVGLVGVLAILVGILSYAVRPVHRETENEKFKNDPSFAKMRPKMEEMRKENDAMTHLKMMEATKLGKGPKQSVGPKDDWYNYQSPGDKGLKEMESNSQKAKN